MKVLINAASAKMGGAATYIKNLACVLGELNLPDEFIFYVPEEQAEVIRGLAPNIQLISTDINYAPFWKRIWLDLVMLRHIIEREKVDVLYSTANLGMFSCPCSQVLLVRNSLHFSKLYLMHILAHKGWRVRMDNTIRRWLICQSVKWADVVITPSQSMLDELQKFVKDSPSKFSVNPYGTILDRFRNDVDSTSGKQDKHFNGHTQLLHVSHYADHKNLGVLFKALRLLPQMGLPNITLSTTADVEDPRYPVSYCRVTDRSLLRQPMIGQRVKKLGDVPHRKLPAVYRAHDVFVLPSLAESYGHPLIEAMASDLPIIVADTPISRELCGDAALYFDPLSAEDLAAKIKQLVADGSLSKQLRERGRLRVRSMTWHSHVGRLLDLFRHLASKGRKRL